MGSIRVDAARREVAELNARFHARELAGEAFYSQLLQEGFAYASCVLVSLVPEGGNAYTGQVIRQDARVFEFDVDLDSSEFTTWRDVTDAFHAALKRDQMKPWSPERVAYEEYLRMRGEA